jgi:hypothetical protein
MIELPTPARREAILSERAAIITLRRGASTIGKIGLAVLLGFAGAGTAGAASLRVCADPDNMPFSNEKAEGFENKLAELIAQKLNATLQYSWFAESTGYVPNTMGREACDLVMGYAQGTGLIEDTNPYYYTSYVLIHREKDASLAGIDNLSASSPARRRPASSPCTGWWRTPSRSRSMPTRAPPRPP